MGPSCARSNGARKPGGSSAVACLHHCTRVAPEDRHRPDLIVFVATTNGVALCCDATLVLTLARNGQPAHAADSRDGAALNIARRRKAARYPELGRETQQFVSTRPAQAAPRAARLARSSCRTGRAAGGAFWVSRSNMLSAAPGWARGAR